MLSRFNALFPVWALLICVLAYLWPASFVSLKPAIVPLLALIMFGMGVSLKLEDFRRVLAMPSVIGLGVALQILVMPFAGWMWAELFGFSALLMVGFVLVGASPGGTASNVICYLAKGDVALSITLTMVSTLLAIFATPFLTDWYVGKSIPVPLEAMMLSVLKIVILPVAFGVLLNTIWHRQIAKMGELFPSISIVSIVVIIGIVIALNVERLETVAGLVILAVILHNLTGLLLGYWLSRLMGKDVRTARTLAIEVGMQNSGLSVALAVKHFAATAALPGALFSIWHNLSGSILAAWWSRSSRH